MTTVLLEDRDLDQENARLEELISQILHTNGPTSSYRIYGRLAL